MRLETDKLRGKPFSRGSRYMELLPVAMRKEESGCITVVG